MSRRGSGPNAIDIASFHLCHPFRQRAMRRKASNDLSIGELAVDINAGGHEMPHFRSVKLLSSDQQSCLRYEARLRVHAAGRRRLDARAVVPLLSRMRSRCAGAAAVNSIARLCRGTTAEHNDHTACACTRAPPFGPGHRFAVGTAPPIATPLPAPPTTPPRGAATLLPWRPTHRLRAAAPAPQPR